MGNTNQTPKSSNVYYLTDYRIPSYRRRHTSSTGQSSNGQWTQLARQRGTQRHAAAVAAPPIAQPQTHTAAAGVKITGNAHSMRISGRMADVYAAIEQLAQTEAVGQ